MYLIDLVLAGILGAAFAFLGLWYWLVRPMARLLGFEKDSDPRQERDAEEGA